MVLSGFKNWQKCSTSNTNNCVIKGLEENRAYMFRVKAQNEKGFLINFYKIKLLKYFLGLSEASAMNCKAVCKEVVEAPKLDISTLHSVQVKAGNKVNISLNFSGEVKI